VNETVKKLEQQDKKLDAIYTSQRLRILAARQVP
jgi:hypothetical protein